MITSFLKSQFPSFEFILNRFYVFYSDYDIEKEFKNIKRSKYQIRNVFQEAGKHYKRGVPNAIIKEFIVLQVKEHRDRP